VTGVGDAGRLVGPVLRNNRPLTVDVAGDPETASVWALSAANAITQQAASVYNVTNGELGVTCPAGAACPRTSGVFSPNGEAVAIGFSHSLGPVVQLREPAGIALPPPGRAILARGPAAVPDQRHRWVPGNLHHPPRAENHKVRLGSSRTPRENGLGGERSGDRANDQGRPVAPDGRGNAVVPGLYRFKLSLVQPAIEQVRDTKDPVLAKAPKPDVFVVKLAR